MFKRLIATLLAAASCSAFAVQTGFPSRAQDSITTQNLVAAGTATAGSCVVIDARGVGGAAVGVTGTYTGALSGQVTVDNTTWTTMAPTPFAPYTALGTPTATIGSGATGAWQVSGIAGASQFRVCALAAVTGSAVVSIQAIEGSAASGAGSSGGGGAVTIASGAAVDVGAQADTVCATDTGACTLIALVKKTNSDLTASNAQLPTALGSTTAANSLSVTMASNDAMSAKLPAALGQTTSANSMAVVLPSDQAFYSSVPLTRTADTNVYAANDVLGAATGSTAALSFTSMCQSGGRVMITSASLEIDAAAIISGETSYVLHLYNVTPPSALGDNAAFDLPSGDRASYLGSINLGTPVDLGSTLYVATDGVNKQIKCSGTGVFGYLVTVGTYTPTSARVHVVNLHAVGL